MNRQISTLALAIVTIIALCLHAPAASAEEPNLQPGYKAVYLENGNWVAVLADGWQHDADGLRPIGRERDASGHLIPVSWIRNEDGEIEAIPYEWVPYEGYRAPRPRPKRPTNMTDEERDRVDFEEFILRDGAPSYAPGTYLPFGLDSDES